MSSWDIDKARATYNIAHWSGGYFDIGEAGHVCASPRGIDGPGVDLAELGDRLHEAGLTLPVLVRFMDILHGRIDTLCGAFDHAAEERGYQGRYTAVYPIKVNQQRSVVDEIVHYGGARIGLEAGSKAELLAVLARASSEGLVVCNGYKDREYMRLALIGQALGLRVIVVIEKFSELELLLNEADKLGIEPLLGVRVRLASISAGKWQNTGGEKSKFGLQADELLRVIARLEEKERLSCLQMLHFHMGSQISSLEDIGRGVAEGARFYAALRAGGAPITYVNVGGGLAVDYEGTRSRSPCSHNYDIAAYARTIVEALAAVCQEQGLPHPHIVSESGRALSAHHAMLITQVVEVEQVPGPDDVAPVSDDAPAELKTLWVRYQGLSPGAVVEAYQAMAAELAAVREAFGNGSLSLVDRAHAEELYFALCQRMRAMLDPARRAHREILDSLNERLSAKYFCNFSLFQSVPDVWGIDQVFPVMPLNRLDEAPVLRGVIEDITCDSDGRIDLFPDGEGVETTLPLHAPREGERYLLGIFMVGAYQEILGDMHNLFGDTDAVDVRVNEAGQYQLSNARRGDDVAAVLRYVHFDPESLQADYERKIDAAGLDGRVREEYLAALSEGLQGYTYLED